EHAEATRAARAPAPTRGDDRAPTRPAAAGARVAPGAGALDLEIERVGTRLGAANRARLEKLGLHTVGDALRFYPYRHHDFTRTVPIAALRIGVEQTVQGVVERAREVRMGRGGRMRAAEAFVRDAQGSTIQAIWFNQPFVARSLREGEEVALAGRVGAYRNRPAFTNPEYEKITPELRHTGRLVPVYHLTQGLPQRTVRGVIAGLLERFADRMEDPLPEEIRERHDLLPLVDAVRQVHYPDGREALATARRRLAFDELLAIQVGVIARKRAWQAQGNAPMIGDHRAADAFLEGLPFTLTGAQRRALHELRGDLARSLPMSRLMEGDVGSGKTVVALAAMLSLVAAGYQAVMMAPTEVLAEQHYRTICRLLSAETEPPLHGVIAHPALPAAIRVVLLTGSTRARERREALDAIRHGGAPIAVGTHALIQEGVEFDRLGFAVVDEQHRFGVMQRSELRRKGAEGVTPHLLVMSATPIPRSLALTAYGDLDLSVIDEMPPGRTPIETRFLTPIERGTAFARVREEVTAGRQAFVICPLVEGSESVISRAATEEFERLRAEEFPDLADRIVLLHGRMSSSEKDAVMRAFVSGEAAILVSTAVVEVGIDVPNATVMAIEGADRFGLAQLHQFRGRVGRGRHPSYCYLLADDPTPEAEERLSVLERTLDGFDVAQADLELRGPGDLFGTQQSGLPNLHVASLLDTRLIEATRREAERLLDEDPRLARPEHRALRYAIAERAREVLAEHH
ncbi:MAG: ATP-dependent DNA helicase RecG, partial [Chloroflexi bacterium]|nr:ATP-dependent DNA helicase RecG [Chloroflexota bacterium]